MFLKKKWYLESKSYRTILRSTAKARTNEKKKKEEKKERKKERKYQSERNSQSQWTIENKVY